MSRPILGPKEAPFGGQHQDISHFAFEIAMKFHGEKLLPQEGIGCSSEGSSDPEQDAPDAPPPMEVETSGL